MTYYDKAGKEVVAGQYIKYTSSVAGNSYIGIIVAVDDPDPRVKFFNRHNDGRSLQLSKPMPFPQPVFFVILSEDEVILEMLKL
jgi:hypothetical protein